MRWAPQDWLASSLRGELALERDHLTRAVYLDLLYVLHTKGGYLHRSEVPGACLVSPEDAERAVSRLLTSKRILLTEDGRLYNERILESLAEEEAYREGLRDLASRGGRASASSLTPQERSERARAAAEARHAKRVLTVGQQDANAPPPPPLPPPEKKKKGPPKGGLHLCPDALSAEDQQRLERLAQKDGFTPAQCGFAFESVRNWSRAGGKRKARWVETVLNAMRKGWALEGGPGRSGGVRPLPSRGRSAYPADFWEQRQRELRGRNGGG